MSPICGCMMGPRRAAPGRSSTVRVRVSLRLSDSRTPSRNAASFRQCRMCHSGKNFAEEREGSRGRPVGRFILPPAGIQWVAPKETPCRQYRAFRETELFVGLGGVLGACREEAAGGREERGYIGLVEAQEAQGGPGVKGPTEWNNIVLGNGHRFLSDDGYPSTASKNH